ncbi:hypothetical protein CPB84DRAFT_1782616 [Gymnopilus junonius]|uniref:Uncharacterized protein n=1 Tax=Gymnopilus junonius TaxID=109634 RepID=A0A9P5NKZ0_GYMJU|nr:hypothetical protein CPB84DRAFT_1782616 [Gymnopilus junonius]
MSPLARRALLACSRPRPTFLAQRRAASSSSHDQHEAHQHHEEDSTAYPPETFGSPFWRNVVLASLATAALFKFAPYADDDVYLTRWIAMYMPSRDYWLRLNAQYTAIHKDMSEDTVLVNSAHAPNGLRFSYPQSLTQASAFLNGVGMNVDMKGVVPK